jgi:hypothetical protein
MASGAAAAGLFLSVNPWPGIGLASVLVGAALTLASPPKWRGPAMVGTATMLTLLAVEAFLAVRLASAPFETYQGNYSSQEYWDADDPELGYRPRAGAVGTSARLVGDREIYRVTYSIGPDSLRRSSLASSSVPVFNCVFFFGDSFMFGEGLNDQDTLPWIVQERAGETWKTLNFGFHGYGPHQMLAAIEAGRVRRAAGDCPGERVVVMQYSEEHVGRALGRASWDVDGPWYVLGDGGRAVRAGRLDERPDANREILKGRYRPEILKWFDWMRLFWVTDADRRFFVALIGTARERLLHAYPGLRTHLILLDADPDPFVTEALDRQGVLVHPIRSILPNWQPTHPDYTISGDGHPNRQYNEIVGQWVYSRLLKPNNPQNR